jgi:hypothetical protein
VFDLGNGSGDRYFRHVPSSAECEADVSQTLSGFRQCLG